MPVLIIIQVVLLNLKILSNLKQNLLIYNLIHNLHHIQLY